MKRSNGCIGLQLVVYTTILQGFGCQPDVAGGTFSAPIWLSSYKKQGEDKIIEVATRRAPTSYKWSQSQVNMGSRQSQSTWICLKKLAGFLGFSYLSTRFGFTGISSMGLRLSWVISTTQHDQTNCRSSNNNNNNNNNHNDNHNHNHNHNHHNNYNNHNHPHRDLPTPFSLIFLKLHKSILSYKPYYPQVNLHISS